MPLRFSDAATTTLTATASISATTLSVSSVESFPQSMLVGDFFIAILSNSENTVRETIKVTAISSLTFTVVRGYDDTIALEWPAGTKIEIRGGSALFKEVINSVVSAPATAEDNAVMVFDSVNNKSKSSNLKALNNNASYQYVVTPEVPFKAAIPTTFATITNQISYTTPGTYSYVVPAGVTTVSAVAVGGGGGGASNSALNGVSGGGGGGGALHWRTFTVTPGETLTVVVGSFGFGGFGVGLNDGSAGGDSYIRRSSTDLVFAGGGARGAFNSAGTTAAGGVSGFSTLGGGGGNGGSGGGGSTSSTSGGGGGAGGYSGNGGNGSTGTTLSSVTAGSGGGGSGSTGTNTLSTIPTWHGGGVGIFGEGASGAAPSAIAARAGNPGSGGVAGDHGGGGVGAEDDSTSGLAGNGRNGAVRIIWGIGRTYPSTLTTDQPVVNITDSIGYPEIPLVAAISNTRVKDSITFKSSGNTIASGIDFYNSNDDLQGSIIANEAEFIFNKPLRDTAFSGSTLDLFGVGNIKVTGNNIALTTRSQSLNLNETLRRQTFSVHGFEFKTDNGIITPVNKTKIVFTIPTNNTWTVPAGVNHIFVKMWGGGGSGGAYGGWRQGSVGGGGGYSHGLIPVVPGDTVTIRPGGGAFPRWGTSTAFPDGGACSTGGGDNRYAGSGGGSSSIRITSFAANAWCMFAGGGGGGGSVNGYALNSGGAGGGLVGQPGVYSGYNENLHNGKGGTQTAGGAAGTGNNTTGGAGSFNQGGTHQNTNCYGGGGGGGYYGGGSGAHGNSNSMGGGGGGSGFVHPNIIMGVTLTGNLHVPANANDPDLAHDGAFQYASGGEEDGVGVLGPVVIYY